jgi:sugar phosphate isomerase/epimerase
MSKTKFAVIAGTVGSCSDRFVTGGYGSPYQRGEFLDKLARIEGLGGVELCYGSDVTEETLKAVDAKLKGCGLKVASIGPDVFGQARWGKGAFTSKDPSIRKAAIAHVKSVIDMAAEMGGDLVNIWPGQDGYDYCFQADYLKERAWFVEGVKECCRHRRDVRVAVEYKPKEPRTHSYIGTAATALLAVNQIDEPNCGITIDIGHAFVAYENAADAVALFKQNGDKLIHVHMNDNYRLWDDDMMVGSVHFIEYLEFFYWLKRTGYDGWLSVDQFLYREDGIKGAEESIRWMQEFIALSDRLEADGVGTLIETGDALEIQRFLRNRLFLRSPK